MWVFEKQVVWGHDFQIGAFVERMQLTSFTILIFKLFFMLMASKRKRSYTITRKIKKILRILKVQPLDFSFPDVMALVLEDHTGLRRIGIYHYDIIEVTIYLLKTNDQLLAIMITILFLSFVTSTTLSILIGG